MIGEQGQINIFVYEAEGKKNAVYTDHLGLIVDPNDPETLLCTGEDFQPTESSQVFYDTSSLELKVVTYHSFLPKEKFVKEMTHLKSRYEFDNPNCSLSEYVADLLTRPKKGGVIPLEKTLPAGPLELSSLERSLLNPLSCVQRGPSYCIGTGF